MSGGKGSGPAHQAGLHYGKDHAGKYVDINPLNMEAYPNQKPAPDQPFNLPTERQVHPLVAVLCCVDHNVIARPFSPEGIGSVKFVVTEN